MTNIPSPYRVDFFNELGKYCQLTVLFERAYAKGRDDSWKQFNAENFEPVFLKGIEIGTDKAFCPSVKKYLKKEKYDHIVVSNFLYPTGMMAVRYLRRKKIPYQLESDGGFAGSGKGFKEKIKKYFVSGAELYFSTAKEHDRYYLTYGAEADKIVRYPFSSLHDADIIKSPVSKEERALLRSELGMREEKILLTAGRFIHCKGYDLLIKAMKHKDLENVGCYIVGGQAPEEYTSLVSELGLENIHFVDFKQKEELAKYYKAADSFVLPTRKDVWGLVVNEAMAFGLPVITTDKCTAGLELVKDGENGFIVPTEDVEALQSAIIQSVVHPLNNEKSLEIIRHYTCEEMAKRHIEIWTKQNEMGENS